MNKLVKRQTGLPASVTDAVGEPSFSYGFSHRQPRENIVGHGAGTSEGQTRFSTTSFFSDATSRLLLGANERRKYLAIQNIGTVDIFVSFGSTAQLSGVNSFKFPPNTGITFETGIVPNNEITVVSSSLNQISVVEGNRI